jgi:hypothetical protein
VDVSRGDLGVELREALEEGAVDDADSAVEVVEGRASYSTGDEDVTIEVSLEQ